MEPRSELLDGVRWDPQGLVPAVVQDAHTGEVRMVAFMNREALERTLTEGVVWFFSRSRGRLWKKGETSGNTLTVRALWLDCDHDCVLIQGLAAGPTCHTGAPSCFFTRVQGPGSPATRPLGALERLEATIAARRDGPPTRSYTQTLFTGGALKIGEKLREEADEVSRALAGEAPERVAEEAADVLFHLLAGLSLRGVALREVLAVLERREGVSGLDEKASRALPREGQTS
ncbi:MAG: bifunctional phosphoribosyl-AMP cyclohydrolase/phosphoribosyl-ATP diphosphatase HisIE [Deltaproteobacteria bacterium]|nr:bifunctional phosphoribosyl-AMP cyclohydrolase/phosphoribosyl-ATP diphosphatase HisIE [Deltaproteobacteria bacterium]